MHPISRPNAWRLALPFMPLCAVLALAAPPTRAGYLDDIGFAALAARPGIMLPDGAAVIIDQVEASRGDTPEAPIYLPDPGAAFAGVTFVDRTMGPNPAFSSHATNVALLFAGDAAMTPGIATVDNYEAGDWLNAVLLNDLSGPSPPRPALGTGTLANHSWVGSTGEAELDADLLTRLDFIIEEDDYTHVTGATNTARGLLGQAYNVIAVTATRRPFTGASDALDAFYTAGRSVPHVVAPLGTPSSATAVVSAAAALLIDASDGDALPTELLKAALMAGADRITRNSNPNSEDIAAYQADATNGLDRRFGAGQLNVANSYDILEQTASASLEDGGTVASPVAGHAYDPAFGGANDSNATATYVLGPTATAGRLSATLAWNAAIVDPAGAFFPVRTLHNLDLELRDVTGGDLVVTRSASTDANTETLTAAVEAGHGYALIVSVGGGGPFEHDFALAWRLEADVDGDGIADRFETAACPAVDDADSDDDGLADGAEDLSADGVVDAGETDPCNPDSDGDGVQDGTEQGITSGVADPDGDGPLAGTAAAAFIPDADPATSTDPLDSDSDGDGFSDGAEDSNGNGAVDVDESDPNDADSTPYAQVPVPLWAGATLALLVGVLGRGLRR
ncbi:MAG: hypothetical protein ACU85V_05330 [Gammaproteobacteria bacterium]